MKLLGGRSRAEARSAERGEVLGGGVPLPMHGVHSTAGDTPGVDGLGVSPAGKFLEFETQFGAIWCILARN